MNILKNAGADINTEHSLVRIKKSKLSFGEIDAHDIPDAVPALAVAAAYAKGTTVITGAERLRIKESDRIKSVIDNLTKMGISAQETPDGMIIKGGKPHGAKLDGFNDHRIVMAFSVAALAADGESEISDALSINKSYPEFFDDFGLLGGMADVINNR